MPPDTGSAGSSSRSRATSASSSGASSAVTGTSIGPSCGVGKRVSKVVRRLAGWRVSFFLGEERARVSLSLGVDSQHACACDQVHADKAFVNSVTSHVLRLAPACLEGEPSSALAAHFATAGLEFEGAEVFCFLLSLVPFGVGRAGLLAPLRGRSGEGQRGGAGREACLGIVTLAGSMRAWKRARGNSHPPRLAVVPDRVLLVGCCRLWARIRHRFGGPLSR